MGVVGHLIVGEETDWVPRTRLILEHGEARIFERFDRFAQLEADGGSESGPKRSRGSALDT